MADETTGNDAQNKGATLTPEMYVAASGAVTFQSLVLAQQMGTHQVEAALLMMRVIMQSLRIYGEAEAKALVDATFGLARPDPFPAAADQQAADDAYVAAYTAWAAKANAILAARANDLAHRRPEGTA